MFTEFPHPHLHRLSLFLVSMMMGRNISSLSLATLAAEALHVRAGTELGENQLLTQR